MKRAITVYAAAEGGAQAATGSKADEVVINVMQATSIEAVDTFDPSTILIVFMTLLVLLAGVWLTRKLNARAIEPENPPTTEDCPIAPEESEESEEGEDDMPPLVGEEVRYYLLYVSSDGKKIHVNPDCTKQFRLPIRIPCACVHKGITIDWCSNCADTEAKRATAVNYMVRSAPMWIIHNSRNVYGESYTASSSSDDTRAAAFHNTHPGYREWIAGVVAAGRNPVGVRTSMHSSFPRGTGQQRIRTRANR